jgi:hypothetical protein
LRRVPGKKRDGRPQDVFLQSLGCVAIWGEKFTFRPLRNSTALVGKFTLSQFLNFWYFNVSLAQRELLAEFDEMYRRYMTSTPAFLPRFGGGPRIREAYTAGATQLLLPLTGTTW